MTLRADVQDGKITVWHDGEMIFACPIEDHTHAADSVALYFWGSAGIGFDDVTVTRVGDAPQPLGPLPDFTL